MNAFDLIVTMAFGSTLAGVLLTRAVPLVEGILALALLVGWQFIIAWLSVRSNRFQKTIKSEPRLLVHNGEMLYSAMKNERVVIEEIYAAIRSQGVSDLCDVAAVVLETDGTFTVLKKQGEGNFVRKTTLKHVHGREEAENKTKE